MDHPIKCLIRKKMIDQKIIASNYADLEERNGQFSKLTAVNVAIAISSFINPFEDLFKSAKNINFPLESSKKLLRTAEKFFEDHCGVEKTGLKRSEELVKRLIKELNSKAFGASLVALKCLKHEYKLAAGCFEEYNSYASGLKLVGELQPPLEETPIKRNSSEPQADFVPQIAANESYFWFEEKPGGTFTVFNRYTSLRAVFPIHNKRVTCTAFFAEDVHLFASVSVDGRLCILKISEVPDDEGAPQITTKFSLYLEIGEGTVLHRRVCWHSVKQEVLVVGFGKYVLKIDYETMVGKGEVASAKESLKSQVVKQINDYKLIGSHEGEITDLSMCKGMSTHLVSASMDGTVKIWEDGKAQPLAVLRPHDGQPINAARFLTAPNKPEHLILITVGPLNREVKIWSSNSEEGWLLSSDAESWKCTQTLELKSSEQLRDKGLFFNRVVELQQLSSDAESWKCTQTQELKSSEQLRDKGLFFNQVVELQQPGLLLLANVDNGIDTLRLQFGPYPTSTRIEKLVFPLAWPILRFSVASSLLTDDECILQVYVLLVRQDVFLVTRTIPLPPSANSGSRFESDVSQDGNLAEGFSAVDPSGSKLAEIAPEQTSENTIRNPAGSNPLEVVISREVAACNMESKPDAVMSSTTDADLYALSPPLTLIGSLSRELSALRSPVDNSEAGSSFSNHGREHPVDDYMVDIQVDENLRNAGTIISQDDSSSILTSSDSGDESHLALEIESPQILAMLDTLNQFIVIEKETAKRISELVDASFVKEGKRLEEFVGGSLEEGLKVNNDALFARFQQESEKKAKRLQDFTDETVVSFTDLIKRDLPVIHEKTIKKDIAVVVGRISTPIIEKTLSSAVRETFQRGIGDKAVNQLDKSVNTKIEAAVARHIQAQFQTSGKQALEDSLKSCFEELAIPTFEMLCKAMFEQVDATIQKGIAEHTEENQQYLESKISQLALKSREAINAASSAIQMLTGELAFAGENASGINILVPQVVSHPREELSRLMSEGKYEDAFTIALQRRDMMQVSWLCSQVSQLGILSMIPVPLSHMVLLSLLHQLSRDINTETSNKLRWMSEVLAAINPEDSMIVSHARPIFEQVLWMLHHLQPVPTMTGPDQRSIRLLMLTIKALINGLPMV